MNEMEGSRMLRLADVIERVPSSHVKMDRWMDNHFDPDLERQHIEPGQAPDEDCGAAGCAFAWAVVIWPEDLTVGRAGRLEKTIFYGTNPKREGYYAAAAFFDITVSQSYDLFRPSHKEAAEVAFDLRQFVYRNWQERRKP